MTYSMFFSQKQTLFLGFDLSQSCLIKTIETYDVFQTYDRNTCVGVNHICVKEQPSNVVSTNL